MTPTSAEGTEAECKHCGAVFRTDRGMRMHMGYKHHAVFKDRHSNPLYHTWNGMHDRCRNPTDKNYRNYGARGITVCERWNDLDAFCADMGARPPRTTLDRIDNNGPYAPWNCRWATHREQKRNTRHNLIISYRGRSLCLKDWAVELGIHHVSLKQRIKKFGAEAAIALGSNLHAALKEQP